MRYDVFISYSSKDSTTAQAICHELEDNHIRCWMAPRDIPVGSKYASVIIEAIKACKAVVLVFSEQSAMSAWVESEINIAFSNRKPIIPYKIDKAHLEDYSEFYLMLNNRHWIEAYPDFEIRFAELVDVVSNVVRPHVEKTGVEQNEAVKEKAPAHLQGKEDVENIEEEGRVKCQQEVEEILDDKSVSEFQDSSQSLTATLNVTSLPTGAIVCVDGEKIGITPIKDIEVSRGRHELKVNKRGYKPRSFTRTFDDKPVVLNIELEKKVKPQSLGNVSSTSIVSSSSITNTSTPKSKERGYVDLGLSVKWATCNIGASTPEEVGTFFLINTNA